MSIKAAISNILGSTPRNNYNERAVKFYKDCLHDGQHGQVVVSHKVYRLTEVAVPFLFPGMTVPPKITARLLKDIESAGESQGYVVHHLLPETYGPNPAADTPPQEEATSLRDTYAEAAKSIMDTATAVIRNAPAPAPAPAPAVIKSTLSGHGGMYESLNASPDRTDAGMERVLVCAEPTQLDVDNFLSTYWSSNNTRMVVKTMSPMSQITEIEQELDWPVREGFRQGYIVGNIWQRCDKIVDTWLKNRGISIRSASGEILLGLPEPIEGKKLDREGVIDLMMSTSYREREMVTVFPGATLTELQGRVNSVKLALARYISMCSPEEIVSMDHAIDLCLVRPNLKRRLNATIFAQHVARFYFGMLFDLSVLDENHGIVSLVNYKDRANTNSTFLPSKYAKLEIAEVNN